MLLNFAIVIQAAVFGAQEVSPRGEPKAESHDYETISPFIPKIAFAFEYQIYFLIVYPYLNKRKIVKRSTLLAVSTSSLMLVYCAGFSGLSLLAN